jgi:ABC-2 type transport system ATP-binding protein
MSVVVHDQGLRGAERTSPLLRFDGVSRSFGRAKALCNLNFELRSGRVVGVVGPNGSGKTTLLRCAAGLILPSRGSVYMMGRNLSRFPSAANGVLGYLGSGDRVFPPRLSSIESLGMMGVLNGLRRRTACKRAVELAEVLGAASFLSEPYQSLSSGQRQRVGMIGALLHRPEVLLLDEPTYALDAESAKAVFGLVRTVAAEGTLVLLSSHDLFNVEDICDDILILDRGVLVGGGPKQTVLTPLDSPGWMIEFASKPLRDAALSTSKNLIPGDRELTAHFPGPTLDHSLVSGNVSGIRSIHAKSRSSLQEAMESHASAAGFLEGSLSISEKAMVDFPERKAPQWFPALLAIMRRDAKTDLSYRFKMIVQLVVLLIWSVTVFYMAQVYRSDGGFSDALYGNAFGFLLIGLAALEVSHVTTGRMQQALREEQLLGTLEPILATGRNPLFLVLGSLLFPLITVLVLSSCMYLMAGLFVELGSNTAWTACLVAAGFGCLSLSTLGLVSVSFVHLFKRGDPLSAIVNVFGLLLAGAYFPREVMPEWVQSSTAWIPYTSALDAVRNAALLGNGFESSEFLAPFRRLVGYNIVAVPLALLIWRAAHQRARAKGNLTKV